jgi:predicted alpha/beta-fold hydrolase
MRPLISTSFFASLLFSFSSIFTQPVLAQLADAAGSRSFYTNPLAMTITQVLAGPSVDKAKRSSVSVYPERRKTPLLEDRGDLRFAYRLQADRTAPLVFVIPGTGGNSESHSAHFMAEKLFDLGYHTVVLDDPFSWNFVVSGSRSSLPGYMPQDAQDLYLAMQKINAQLIQELNIHPRSYSLTGASLGALLTLFVNRIDKQFHFEKVLLVNPPLDLLYGVKQLDNLYNEGNSLSEQRKLVVFNRLIDIGQDVLKNKTLARDRAYMQKTFDRLGFDDRDMSYLIGGSFRESLRDIIFASQQVYDLGILKNKATKYKRNARYDEAMGFSFADYLNKFVYPNVRKTRGTGYDLKVMNRDSSIYQFESTIRSSRNIYVMHSEDDFLIKDGDIAWMKQTFGDRALLFRYGGHCGSMNFAEFSDGLTAVFQR